MCHIKESQKAENAISYSYKNLRVSYARLSLLRGNEFFHFLFTFFQYKTALQHTSDIIYIYV